LKQQRYRGLLESNRRTGGSKATEFDDTPVLAFKSEEAIEPRNSCF
jgi:hypothetical protein